MGDALERLVAAGSEGLAPLVSPPVPLYDRKNGFYAFDSALLVRPVSVPAGPILDVAAWNSRALWGAVYGDVLDGVTFFAEDVFGGQFGFRGDEVVSFNPETGEVEHMASSLEGWATEIIDDCSVMTGHALAREWQLQHRPLAPAERLIPVVPFVLGGEYAAGNLRPVADVEAMRVYGDLYKVTS
ncbi:SMI1/KNR4 family protein [Paractinoplanes atraurantiacus]|uniref:SMI1/KNR4 family protein n=1 Tax=Paractinoplanes atraurantiacus TaxID=1036182 RepID=A0A285KIA5_9ACTN|nr:SMI1/KNR4 family protein [Actinoplanes atraurantiacus]SNY71156.1 hypothetical protein SAMN05421748_13937 [Actinoplanes atraurantiacus]